MLGKLRSHWQSRIGQTKTVLGEKVREALASVLPITLIVLFLCFTAAPVPTDVLLAFLMGAVLLILGMGLFTLGADTAMLPIGERVGAQMTKSRKLWVVVSVSLLIGIIVTISEPDLQVLAGQVPGIPNAVLIGAVAVGVGIFLVVALLRILFQIPLNGLLIASYIVIFALAAFAPKDFLAVAFDSGGVTTGPMTVPFIMALGLGVSSTRSDGKAGEDSFGLVALCSVGPILAVLVLALVYQAAGAYVPNLVPEAGDSRELCRLFAQGFPVYAREMGAALAPIAAFFAVFQVVSLRMPRKNVLKIVVGLLYTYVGLVLFMTGVNVGFLPAGTYLGRQIAALDQNWVLIPIGMLMGWFIVQAEPAVHVLNRQVEELTSGAIPGKAMSTSLSIGVAVSIGLAMLRVLTGVSLRHRPFLRGAQDLHGHRLRLRRRGIRPHDGHLPAALCHGRLRDPGRQCGDGRLRRGGHGGHDAPHHHSAAGPCLQVEAAQNRNARRGRTGNPGGGRRDHRPVKGEYPWRRTLSSPSQTAAAAENSRPGSRTREPRWC